MKKTLVCTCGGSMSYDVTDVNFVDSVFYADHTGDGHEVTEKPGVYICDEE